MLSSDQIRIIRESVEASNIRISTLGDDLIDHLCCSVEEKLNNGKPFVESLNEAINELAPDGFAQLEYETIMLLNSENMNLKKFLYLFGLATTISMTMGITMKLLHMPGSEELFNFGFFAFALFFLPMVSIKQWRNSHKLLTYEKLRIGLGIISALGVGLSVVLKLTFQLEISSVLLLLSAGVFSFGYLPCLFYGMYQKSLLRN